MATSYTSNRRNHKRSYLDISMHYSSAIDSKVESEFARDIRAFNKSDINTEIIHNILDRDSQFVMNYSVKQFGLNKEEKINAFKTKTHNEVYHTFGTSSIIEVLDFYVEVTDSFDEVNKHRQDIEQAKLAITCFTSLLNYHNKFNELVNGTLDAYICANHTFTDDMLKILFRVRDASLKSNLYMSWLALLESSKFTAVGLKIHAALLQYHKIISSYIDKINNDTITEKDETVLLNGTKELLVASEFIHTYLDVDNFTSIIELCRHISTDIRLLERMLGLPNYATTKAERVTGYTYLELSYNDKKEGFDLGIAAEICIDLGTYIILTIDFNDRKIEIDDTSMSNNKTMTEDMTTKLNLVKQVCKLCQSDMNNLMNSLTYSKAVCSLLTTIALIRTIVDSQHFNIEYDNIQDLYTTLYSTVYYANQADDTIYIPRVINAMLEDTNSTAISEFMRHFVHNPFITSALKNVLVNIDNAIPVNNLYNRMYNVLKVSEPDFYQLKINIYDDVDIDKILSKDAIEKLGSGAELARQHTLALFVADTLFWLDTYLEDIDCDCDIFQAYETGMQNVYKKYPYMQEFFSTYYSFYLVGVIAYMLNDYDIPVQVLANIDSFNIDTLAKKLRKVLTLKQKQAEEEKRRLELAERQKEREEERKRRQELEAQRLAEQKAAEEKERLKQLNLEEANKIMEELNKKAWAGFTVPQQQAAYVRYLQEGNEPLAAAKLVKEEFIRRQEEEEALLARWEHEEEAKRLKKEQLAKEAEEKRKADEQKAYKELCDKADQQYEDMRAGRAIFPNVLLSAEEQKTAPLLNVYDIVRMFPDMTTAAKLIKKVYDAPGDVLAVDIITEELIRLNEIKSSQIIDPIDKEVMSSAKALANKHCVPYSRFTKLVELGMPVEQALIIPPERLLLLAKLYKADKIVHDRKGHYIICKGEYIVPVTYRELREVYIKLKNVKGDSDE